MSSELDNRRRGFLKDCRLCSWGLLAACNRALAYPYLNFEERGRVQRLRAKTMRRRRRALYGLGLGVLVVAAAVIRTQVQM